MSIEANTCEKLTVNNINKKTADIAARIGEYIVGTWGINHLELTVDGKKYISKEDTVEENSEIYEVCKNLGNAEHIDMFMRSCNAGGISWRMESCFMADFKDDDDIKNNIVYKSTDYYDTDAEIIMCAYDEKGLYYPTDNCTDALDDVSDIKEWYSYTPEIRVFAEDECENEELHDLIKTSLTKLFVDICGYEEDEFEDLLDDEWEDCGEIITNGSLRFAAADIGEIKSLLSNIVSAVSEYEDAECEIKIYAVPDGENDYVFAGLAFVAEDGELSVECCRC